MKFKGYVSVLWCLVCVWACGPSEPTEDEQDSGITCPSGQSVSPITGMCMPATAMDMGSSAPEDMGTNPARDMATPVVDMGTNPPQDMGCADGLVYNPIIGQCVTASDDMDIQDDMSADMDVVEDMAVVVDMAPTGGVLVGNVGRSAEPRNGGVGPLFIALFEKNPITASTTGQDPVLVAFQRIENVDFTSSNTMIPYRLEGIPPRAEPYFITAFLDDNMTADTSSPESAGPDRNDLISLDGVGPVTVTIDQADEFMLDLDLNFHMLF